MAKHAMLVDLSRCVGCQACTVACQAEYGLEPDRRYTTVHRYEYGSYPNVGGAVITTQCMHCDNPPCVKACPTGASYKREDGFVLIDEDRCIGCRYCTTACPYGARSYDPKKKIVGKCSFCFKSVSSGGVPACVKTCMAGARVFGDVTDTNSAISKALAGKGVQNIRGTSISYVVPRNLDPSYLPPEAFVPSYISAWKGVVRPVGLSVMGAAAGAVMVSFFINAVKKEATGQKEDGPDEK